MTLHEELKETIKLLEWQDKNEINIGKLIDFLKELESNISFLSRKNIEKEI
jgi:hypothetical protein